MHALVPELYQRLRAFADRQALYMYVDTSVCPPIFWCLNKGAYNLHTYNSTSSIEFWSKCLLSLRMLSSASIPEMSVREAVLACRLNLADATSNEEIEQQLAEPWSDMQVVNAFQETLAGWKARTKPKRMTGMHPLLV